MLVIPRKSLDQREQAPTNSIVSTTSNGPWGQLEYTAIELDRPDETSLVNDAPASPTHWYFEDIKENELLRFFEHDDLSEEQTRQLTDKRIWLPYADGWEVRPSPDLLENLAPAARKRIYGVLGCSPKNWPYYGPFHVSADRFEEWVRKSGLSPEKQALLRRISYPDGDQIYVCDWPLLDSKCTLEERKLLAKNVSRIPALIMKLRILPGNASCVITDWA